MTAAALVAAVAFGGIVLPHLLALQRAEPATACLLWAAALGLRALVVVGTVAGSARSAASRPPAARLRRVAMRAAPPDRRPRRGRAGWPRARRVAGLGARARRPAGDARRAPADAHARGPRTRRGVSSSAATTSCSLPPGLARPTLVVSAGALARLDDAELAAAIAHERGRIRRRHRYVLLYAELCRVLGRPLPGTARAVRQLRFHIERDADRSAVRGRADRLALASAICRAATGATTRAGWLPWAATERPRACASCSRTSASTRGTRGLRTLAVAVSRVSRWPRRCRCRRWSAGSAIRSCSAGRSRPRCLVRSRGRRFAAQTASPRGKSPRWARRGRAPWRVTLGDFVCLQADNAQAFPRVSGATRQGRSARPDRR